MANCKITEGITNLCTDILKVGGAGKTFWVGYLSDLATPFDISQNADLTTIDFAAYGGLYRFDGQKFAHSFGYEVSVASGGNKSFIQTFVWKLFSNSTADDKVIQDLIVGDDIFIVAQDNNQRMFILGAANGLSVSAGTQNTGQTGDSDITDNGTLTGQEPTKPLRFNVNDSFAQTLTRIEGYEI